MGRRDFVWWGLGLFFLKYNLDRVISLVLFQKYWFPWSYLFGGRDQLVEPKEGAFLLTLLAFSLPFIWAGVVMTLRRLRDINWPTWLVVLFFLPFINLIFFCFLALLPARSPETERPPLHRLVATLGLEHRLNAAAFGILASFLLATVLMLFGTLLLKDYGWGLFVGTPFMMGFFSARFYGLAEIRTWRGCVAVAALSIVLVGTALILLAAEGFFCVLMAAPIALLLAVFGATVGWAVQRERHATRRDAISLYGVAWIVLPLLMATESRVTPIIPVIEARSAVVINASPATVWRNIISFGKLEPPQELIFRTGVAYPLYANLEGHGVGAVRHCVFTTGAFIEPITTWDDARRLAFDVESQPHPMREWSPYSEIHPAHLEGFFRSRRGEFVLTALPGGRTRLEGTTWYEQNLWPNFYWRLWSDYLIHAIHQRVLNHIKTRAEQA